MNTLAVSIIFSLCMLLTAIGWFVTNLRTKKVPQISYDSSIDKINDETNSNTGYRFSKKELDERAKYNADNYMDVL
jgi:hypothetical protein